MSLDRSLTAEVGLPKHTNNMRESGGVRTKQITAIVLTAILSSLIATAFAAPATKTPFTAEASFVPGNISLGQAWVTNGSIQHVKGAESEGTVTGDLSGTSWMWSFETVNLKTGKGVNHGKFSLNLDEGTFEGRWRGKITPEGFSVKYVGHGTGTYKGQKMMGSATGEVILDTPPIVEMVLEGIILSPKG